MIRLDKATRSLRAVLAGAVAATQPDVVVSFTDKGSSIGRGFDQRAKLSTTNGATPVTICDAPNATTIREIDFVSIRNNDSASVTVTVSILDGSTSYSLITATLATLEHLHYSAMTGWIAIGTDGRIKTKVASSAVPWETPGTIGSTTPNTGAFTTLTASGTITRGSAGATNGGTIESGNSPVSIRQTFGTDGTGWQYRLAKNQAGVITDILYVTDGDRVGIGLAPTARNNSVFQIKDGIGFPATQVASTDPNVLDHYDEQDWTPTDGSGAGLTLTVNSARCTKAGRKFVLTANITFPVTADATAATISGSPFNDGNISIGSVQATGGGGVDAATINSSGNVQFWISGTGAAPTNAALSGQTIRFTIDGQV